MDNQIIDFQTQLFQCKSFDESWQLYLEEMERCGFAHLLYGYTLFTDNESDPSSFDFSVTNYYQAFLSDYVAVDGIGNDASVDWALDHDEPGEWSLEENIAKLTPTQKLVDEVSRDHGIVYGYTIPVRLPSGNLGGVGCSATDIQKKEFKQDIAPKIGYITVITNLFHLHTLQFPRLLQNAVLGEDGEPLTEKEQEVIKWLAHGYKIQQIAEQKMFRSQESVNLYIRKAKNKLQAPNVAQLVAKAMVLRLI